MSMDIQSRATIPAQAATALMLGLSLASPGWAQGKDSKNYPDRSIHIVVPASPGGINDILARLIGQKLNERFRQPVVVENKPGASTIIATEFVARARPDGYTLLMSPMASMAINPAIYPKLPYTPQRDFVPISLVASYPYILAVNASAPIRTVRELTDYTRANPSKANAGCAAATMQLLTEMFKQRTGAQLQCILYKGTSDANLALISGELLLSFVAPDASPRIKSGQFRALAVTSQKRTASFPDVPTMAEAGVPDIVVVSWAGFFAPAGTSTDIVKTLEENINGVLKLSEIRERLQSQGFDPVGSTSEEFAQIMAKDIDTWSAVAKVANVTIQP
jgi:tripartite-type tricarboxylate transporter receptor subunit TctC